MKRKISMFAVTLCLTAAMLTGCGGNKNGTTTSPAPAASTDNARGGGYIQTICYVKSH